MTTGMNNDIARDAADLTQLSSREQLSALMDGALPADETRFLLRRLQHDASLAESWERWRLSAEVMRGLAPAQRLPADFASRVAASIRGEDVHAQATNTRISAMRTPAWLRWGGGAAMAASLAVAAVMTRPAAVPVADVAAVAVANAAPTPNKMPVPQVPAQEPAGIPLESQTAALATAVAIAARPTRNTRDTNQTRTAAGSPRLQQVAIRAQAIEATIATGDTIPTLLPQADIVTRPWPRAILPQYSHAGINVGFGDSARGAAPYNPFQVQTSVGGLPPALIVPPSDPDPNGASANDEGTPASAEPPQS